MKTCGRPGILLSALTAALFCLGGAQAATYYAAPDNATRCPCAAPGLNTDPRCGTSDNPYSCLADGARKSAPGDTLIARDGTYPGCFAIGNSGTTAGRITIVAEHPRGAIISVGPDSPGCGGGTDQAIYWPASHVTLRGFQLTSATTKRLGTGLIMKYGSDNRLENLDIGGFKLGVIMQYPATDNAITDCDVHDNDPHWGIGIEGTTNLLIERTRIHHNAGSGMLAGPYNDRDGKYIEAIGTIIRDSEIDNNGRTRLAHGLYMKDVEGLIQNNKIHHNAGYGLHLWAAPQGRTGKPYLVEGNDIYGNGFNLTFPKTCDDPNDRFSRSQGGGIVLGGTPDESPIAGSPERGLPRLVEIRGNLVHLNIGDGFTYLGSGCTNPDALNTFHDNTVDENQGTPILLVRAVGRGIRMWNNTLRTADPGQHLVRAYSSNLAENALDGERVSGPGITLEAASIAWNDLLYSLGQVRHDGVRQNQECGITVESDPATPMLGHALLERASPAASAASPGKAPAASADLDRDGTPAVGGDCDDQDARTFPGSAEVCDGKNDDCTIYPAVPPDEVDADRDGYFACVGRCDSHGCDCDDSRCDVSPGAREICNGIDDNCNGTIDESDASCDRDVTRQARPSPGRIAGGGRKEIGFASAEDVYEVLVESGAPNRPQGLTVLWTFDGLQAGKAYRLEVEGHKEAGGALPADDFDLDVAFVSGKCRPDSPFGGTVLTITKAVDDDRIQAASLGVVDSPVICVRARDAGGAAGDPQADRLLLDRLFLVRLP
jgi:Right handed beta helix region/Putative metal-binding motif